MAVVEYVNDIFRTFSIFQVINKVLWLVGLRKLGNLKPKSTENAITSGDPGAYSQ